MVPPGADRGALRGQIERALANARRDALAFAVATIILAPLFCGLAGLLLMASFVLIGLWDLHAYVSGELAFLTGVNVFFVAVFGAAALHLWDQGGRRRALRLELAGGLVILLVMLFISYAAPLAERRPAGFAVTYGSLALLLLGLLGRVYQPRESYDAEDWIDVPIPLPLPGTVKRYHLALGFAVAFPGLLLASLGEVLASLWLLQPFDGTAREVAAAVLSALWRRDHRGARAVLREADKRTARRALVLLSGLGLVQLLQPGLAITEKGTMLAAAARISGGAPAADDRLPEDPP
jgi:hypothetical protein